MSTWKTITDMKYKVSGVWKKILSVKYKVSGVWKQVWPDIPVNMVVLFTSTPPSPWTVVSSPTLDDKYGKCHTAQGSTGGTNTHSHTSSHFVAGAPATVSRLSGIYSGMLRTHTHTYPHGHTVVKNHEPSWYGLCPTTGGFPIPTTGYIFYDGFVDPDGWESNSAFHNKYIKFKTSSPGGTGGATTHSHTEYSVYGSLKTTYTSALTKNSGAGDARPADATHRHNVEHTHTSNNDLSYCTLRPIHPISETSKIPSGAIAFFVGSTVPSGWTQFSVANDKYIKMMSYGGATGGTLTHTMKHSGSTGYSGSQTVNPRSSGVIIVAALSHNHPHSTANHNSATLEPEYQQLLICKKD